MSTDARRGLHAVSAQTDENPHQVALGPADIDRISTRALALQLILDGRRGRAQYELTRSVLRQAHLAGVHAAVGQQLPCPCGGRCTS